MADYLLVGSTHELPCCILKKNWGRRERVHGALASVWAMLTKPRFQAETVGFLLCPQK